LEHEAGVQAPEKLASLADDLAERTRNRWQDEPASEPEPPQDDD
jgi:hypothetical protein